MYILVDKTTQHETWKNITPLRSCNMMWCFLMEDKRSHFLQSNGNSRRLARSVERNYEFHIIVPR
jgi:hypothetical protein